MEDVVLMSRKGLILFSFPLLALAPGVLAQSVITPRVVGTTSTQAVISYTAPDTNACTIVVSESPTLSPVVHDVDATLFTGANLDSRQADLNNGQQRIFVAGKRQSDLALNGKLYSRALQVSTQHYFQVTCGASVASGSFATRMSAGRRISRRIRLLTAPGSGIICCA